MSNDIIALLKGFRLNGITSSRLELLAQARRTGFDPECFMKRLLTAGALDSATRWKHLHVISIAHVGRARRRLLL
ncbi:hypothetical protein P3T18_000989 [Paraburkholderia sp. GAS199]|uniref:hypothetical protein n=1 Tax=Paraburkholderia sp. GAS199 TaxID=3035126 RepID=UPI003D1A11F9